MYQKDFNYFCTMQKKKTTKELTKGFKDFSKKNNLHFITEKDFNNSIKKIIKPATK